MARHTVRRLTPLGQADSARRRGRGFASLLALTAAICTLARAALTERMTTLREDDDRGDIPGWAIAAGASVVLGLLVWAAVQGVVGNYIGKINSGSK